jgi:Sterol desaturase
MILVHDTYFYWTHRLLHTKWLFKKIHTVHHRSVNPTPWAAYAFHPVEALVESLVIFPFITLFPVHYLVFGLFTFQVLVMNVIGHLGFEFIPRRLRFSAMGKFLTSSTHHNLHHQKTRKNFGYYFTFWDRLMRTLQDENSNASTLHQPQRGLNSTR